MQPKAALPSHLPSSLYLTSHPLVTLLQAMGANFVGSVLCLNYHLVSRFPTTLWLQHTQHTEHSHGYNTQHSPCLEEHILVDKAKVGTQLCDRASKDALLLGLLVAGAGGYVILYVGLQVGGYGGKVTWCGCWVEGPWGSQGPRGRVCHGRHLQSNRMKGLREAGTGPLENRQLLKAQQCPPTQDLITG